MLSARAYSFRMQSRLAISLSWVGGYVNVVGWMTFATGVSHVSGNITHFGQGVLEVITHRKFSGAIFFGLLLLCFFLGAASSGLMTELARRSQDPEAGTVRLGLFPTLAPYLLPHVLPAVRARFPKLELLLVEEKTDVVLARLRDGRLDAGILALPLHDEQLHVEPLFEEPFVLAVPRTHRLAARADGLALRDLDREHLLLLEEGHCLRDQALDVCRLAGADERDGFRATSLETLRQMVAAGVGSTLLPVLAVQPPVPPSADVRLLSFRGKPPSREIAMVWRRSSAMSGFLSQLAAQFRALDPSLLEAPGGSPGRTKGKPKR